MKLKKKYKLIFRIGEKTLTYTAEVISLDNGFVTIKDKFNQIYNYNQNCLISYEDVKNAN